LFNCLREARPDLPFLVPRTWEKLKTVIEARIAELPDTQLRPRLEAAIAAGRQRVMAEQAGDLVSAELVERDEQGKALLKSAVLAPLGLDRIQIAFMGGAPCPRDLVEFFQGLGVPVREAYGLTEATGFAAVFPGLDDFKIGTVGRPVPGVELRLADDGEILLRSEMNMLGYRNDPEMTRAAIDDERWLHTGDIGELDADGYLKVIDRKKDLIINSYGKNMSPVSIEATIGRESTLIGTVVVIGDGRPYNVALLTLDPEAGPAFAKSNDLAPAPIAELAAHPRILGEVGIAVERANSRLSRTEQVKAFKLLAEEWLPDSDELTPTMKIKRKQIAHKYAAEIEALYAR
jgi:long-subunit acyl-CoA synthetase (AMP-forming)